MEKPIKVEKIIYPKNDVKYSADKNHLFDNIPLPFAKNIDEALKSFKR